MKYLEYRTKIDKNVEKTLSDRLSSKILTKTADLRQIYEIFKGAGQTVPIGSSFIDPYFKIPEGDIMRSDVLTLMQHRMSEDLFVLYEECNGLDRYISDLDRHIRDTLETEMRSINEAASKTTDYIDLNISEIAGYTDIVHNTFNVADSIYTGLYPAIVDKDSETLKIYEADKEKLNAHGKSRADVFILSRNVQLIEMSDMTKIHSDDVLDPFYTSVIVDGKIENPESLLETSFVGYNGLIVAIRISLSINTIVNQIRLRPFSTDKVDVLDVYLSTSPETPLETSGTSSTVGWYKMETDNKNDNMFFYELNSNTREGIPAREVLLILGERDYIPIKEKLTIRNDLEEITELLSDKLSYAMLEFSPYKLMDNDRYIDPFKDSVERSLDEIRAVDVKDVTGILKHYILGISSLDVNRVRYGIGGIYISPIYKAVGNVIDVLIEDNSMPVVDQDVVSACINYDVYVSDALSIPITPNNDDDPDIIYDAVEMERVEGEPKPFKAGTRFRPHQSDPDMVASYNGKNYTGSSIVVTNTPSGDGKGVVIYIDIPDAVDNDIVILTYKKAETIEGIKYEPNRVNMIDSIGRPNILDEDLMKAQVLDYYIFKPVLTADKKPDYESDDYIIVDVHDCRIIRYKGDEFLIIPNSYSSDVSNAFDDLIPYDEMKMGGSANVLAIPYSYYNGPEKGIYFGFIDINVPNTSSAYEGSTPVPYDLPIDASYRRGSMVVKVNGTTVMEGENYSEWVQGADDPNRLYLWNIENNNKITLSFLPIKPHVQYNPTVHQKSNIRTANREETHNGTDEDKSIRLRAYPYTDFNIIGSQEWIYSNGVYTYSRNISVTYEPVIVSVGGKKAFNVTDYENRVIPAFSGKRIEYYLDGDKLFFSQIIRGEEIRVEYYSLVDVIAMRVSLLRSDSISNALSPAVYAYTLLANVRK